jgi:hypothetical protein
LLFNKVGYVEKMDKRLNKGIYEANDRNVVRGRPRHEFIDQFEQVVEKGQEYFKLATMYEEFDDSRTIV